MAGGYKNKTWDNNNPPQLEDDDLNLWKNESNNLISSSGQTPDNAIADQQAKAVAQYAASGDGYSDTGAADAYVLSPLGSQIAPESYTELMRVRFEPANDCTGGPATANVATLGVKSIKLLDGITDPAVGDIVSGKAIQLYFDFSADVLILLNNPITNQQFTPAFMDGSASGNSGTFVTIATGIVRITNPETSSMSIYVTGGTSGGGTWDGQLLIQELGNFTGGFGNDVTIGFASGLSILNPIRSSFVQDLSGSVIGGSVGDWYKIQIQVLRSAPDTWSARAGAGLTNNF